MHGCSRDGCTIVSGVTVVSEGGRLLAVKRGDAARLRHEADVLRRVDHPGLVSFVSLTETEPAQLHTVFAGPDSWFRHPPADDRAIVAGLAAVAAIVADLHDADATHGSISPAHVVSSADGRPVLCSLADSGRADDAGRSADMAGLGDLLDHCRNGVDGAPARQLQQLAARCHDSSLDARALARELDALEPRATRTKTESRPRAVALGAAAVVAAVALGWATTRDAPAEPAMSEADPQPAPPATPPPPAPSTARPPGSTVTEPPSTTTTTTGLAVLVADPPPGELIHDGRRYQLGRDGDLVVVGDWTCDGIDTPALLRPDASMVVVFDAWPPPHGTVEPAHVTTIIGTALDREAHDECDLLRVRTANGSELIVLPTTP